MENRALYNPIVNQENIVFATRKGLSVQHICGFMFFPGTCKNLLTDSIPALSLFLKEKCDSLSFDYAKRQGKAKT